MVWGAGQLLIAVTLYSVAVGHNGNIRGIGSNGGEIQLSELLACAPVRCIEL